MNDSDIRNAFDDEISDPDNGLLGHSDNPDDEGSDWAWTLLSMN